MQSDIRNESEKDILSKRGYSFVKKLGEGGFSKKFLPRELAILIKVNHPHIISILSIYQRRNNIYIFMRYAENGDLLDYILKNDAVPEDQARIWVKQIALGVQYLHILNIAHRDLKSDFGFACHIKLLNNLPLSYEMSNTFCGTESYAPPEIIHGELYDPKIADIWTFELLKGMLEPNPKNRIKIEEVINSSWIAMNPKLKILNNAEYNAFEKKGNHNLNFKVDKKNRESFTIFREEDSSFNMQIITSDAVDVVNKTTNV
ncbi:testis-specific serine/threonine-protein kinase 2-like [Condylostylus longicornis]|uniref:testis-specific serine/threonine-protein kinase 2-like n=1 Tax=Condylostylus longicornis TaxID=2530218 RepID=UPI00244DDB38|nr:testis-specific serine/threonine-protein kinase 2-like [Condylostylus longicornis]